MKAVNVDDVFKILNWYGQFIFITYEKRYTEMMDEIANLPSTVDTMLDQIRADIENDWQLKEFPASPFSCGLRHALEIIDKNRKESEVEK